MKNTAMKKIMILALAFALLCLVPPADAENDPTGDWFAVWQGLPLRLTLNGDGTYSLQFAVIDAGAKQGVWMADDGRLILDEDQENALTFDGKTLAAADGAFALTRQEQESPFSPAPDAEAELAAFSGEWESRTVNAFGVVLPADALGLNLKIWIDENLVALDGADLFGGAVLDFDFSNGVLRKELGTNEAPLSLELRMLQDGSLRFTLTVQNDALTFYLERVEKSAGESL